MRASLRTFLGLFRRFEMLVVVVLLTILALWFSTQTRLDTALYEMNTRLTRIEFKLGIAQPAPATPSTKKPTAPCTLERATAENPQALAKTQKECQEKDLKQEQETQRAIAVLNGLLKATGIQGVPANLSPLPRDTFDFSYRQYVPAPYEKNNRCTLWAWSEGKTVHHGIPFSGAWNQLASLALYGFHNPSLYDERASEWGPGWEQVLFFQDLWLPFGGRAWAEDDDEPLDRLRPKLLAVIEDEVALGKLAPWALRIVPPLLYGEARTKAQAWLTDLWSASRTDLEKLSGLVDNNANYFYDASSPVRLQGLFMRRWRSIKARQGKARADAMIVVYRFWMAQAAQALGHPQASAWKQEVAREFGTTRGLTYEAWYKSQLPRY